MHDDTMLAERAVQLGARGYITKNNAPEVLAALAAARQHAVQLQFSTAADMWRRWPRAT